MSIGKPRGYGHGIVYEPEADLAKVEELWGPPPWTLDIQGPYGPEVMRRVASVTVDGTRFVRAPERDWDVECEVD